MHECCHYMLAIFIAWEYINAVMMCLRMFLWRLLAVFMELSECRSTHHGVWTAIISQITNVSWCR